MLHDITDKPNGWLQLVKSLVRVVPIEHPMGPSVIMLLLDDSPLPTKDSVLEVADMITHSLRRTPRRERNLCIILGCLAEKLAGISVAVLSETTLGYLLGNLVSDVQPISVPTQGYIVNRFDCVTVRGNICGRNALFIDSLGEICSKK